MFDVQFVLLVF